MISATIVGRSLRQKSEVHTHIVNFVAYAHTQFSLPIRCFHADNGTEFVNNATAMFLAARGVLLRTSCPYTSAQNGKAERMLRTLNNTVRTLLIHASHPLGESFSNCRRSAQPAPLHVHQQ